MSLAPLRYGLISDTHGHLHPGVFRLFEGVEAILHAGDVGKERILVELGAIAPAYAVCGNCDSPSVRMPPLRIVELPFGRLILAHSHLQEVVGRDPESLAAHFRPQGARVVVYGHTHLAFQREFDGVWVINPGPAGRPRLRDIPSVALMEWDQGSGHIAVRFHMLDWKGSPGL